VQGLETKEEYNGNVFSMWKKLIKLQLMQAVGMKKKRHYHCIVLLGFCAGFGD